MLFTVLASAQSPDLRVGAAFHAFDHLGGIDHQAEAAAASGATVIYDSGVGGEGYGGLPPAEEFERRRRAEADYVKGAKAAGIQTVIGYLCATSIVKLASFDANWTPAERAEFGSASSTWLQQDRDGHALPSWYGGDYFPACMNNPGWRAYERFMVRQQLETGHDGIFFDNPTVHPKGCYCPECMKGFAGFLQKKRVSLADRSPEAMRKLADEKPREFAEFRSTIARDFLSEMRRHARTLNPNALVTANNSLNASSVLYSQCRTYGYNIFEMSRAEDLVVVEDMSSQPRTLDSGKTLEYGPTLKQLHAISHGVPIVAVTIAEGNYHTPPNLMRLAMTEAAANDATYLMWPTWPEEQRARMSSAARLQNDWIKNNARYFRDGSSRREAVLFLPFRRCLDTADCAASKLAAVLTSANVQYEVISEEDFRLDRLLPARALVVESFAVLNESEHKVADEFKARGGVILPADDGDWKAKLREAITNPAIEVNGPSELRANIRDGARWTAVHILNLNVKRISSFEDEVHPALAFRLKVRVAFKSVRSARLLTADPGTKSDSVAFTVNLGKAGAVVAVAIPKVEVAATILIESSEGE